MQSEPADSALTKQLSDSYAQHFDGARFAARPEIACTARGCSISVRTGDEEELAHLDHIHGDLGITPLTSASGDPAQGIIDSVTYYIVVSEDAQPELLGSRVRTL